MSGHAVGFNCSVVNQPHSITPNPDISGVGVVASYVATAGLAVTIITVYYLSCYDPNTHPSKSSNTKSISKMEDLFQPNPIDKLLLGGLRRLWSRKPPSTPSGRRRRIESALVKCILSMSDLQLLSGYAILISGYAQLKQGLSCFEWQQIVYLAWFSAITHLSCLTFLRSHLFSHRVERVWRIVAMGALAIMLSVALVPTGHYGPGFFDPYESRELPGDRFSRPGSAAFDYAICSFNLNFSGETNFSFRLMVLSVILLVSGFVSRTLWLHQAIAFGVVARARAWSNDRALRILRKIYHWCDVPHRPCSLRRYLLYRPALAIYLVTKLTVDIWSSMAFEVWWLLVSFGLGVSRIWTFSAFLPKDSRWSFGQIVALAMLAAPLVSVIEYFSSDDTGEIGSDVVLSVPNAPSTPCSSPVRLPQPVTATLPVDAMDNPDQDFYTTSRTFRSFVLYPMAPIIYLSVTLLNPNGMNLGGSAFYLIILAVGPNAIAGLMIAFTVEKLCEKLSSYPKIMWFLQTVFAIMFSVTSLLDFVGFIGPLAVAGVFALDLLYAIRRRFFP